MLSACASSENIIVPDTSPPVISSTEGSGTYPFGTTKVTLTLVTEQPAECRIGNSPGHPFGALYTTFMTQDGLTHTVPMSTYDPGKSFYYARCRNLKNLIENPEEIQFDIEITSNTTARE